MLKIAHDDVRLPEQCLRELDHILRHLEELGIRKEQSQEVLTWAQTTLEPTLPKMNHDLQRYGKISQAYWAISYIILMIPSIATTTITVTGSIWDTFLSELQSSYTVRTIRQTTPVEVFLTNVYTTHEQVYALRSP